LKITLNSIVTLHHKLGLTDGSILEDTFDEEPLTYHLGTGELAEGLELSLIDLEEGDEQTLDIGPDLAFGFPVDDMVHTLPRDEFDPQQELTPGLIIEFSTPSGETVPGTILEFNENSVQVDFNHPLAGQTIRYSVKIIAIEEADEAPQLLN
jgi:FKBP-type peptidyl-prolyl cis-trans isomerase SlpA